MFHSINRDKAKTWSLCYTWQNLERLLLSKIAAQDLLSTHSHQSSQQVGVYQA